METSLRNSHSSFGSEAAGEASSRKSSARSTPKRSGVKILQCNDELCQYESRPQGDIEWAPHSKHLVKLTWDSPPKMGLIIKKPNAHALAQAVRDVANYMYNDLSLTVLVEPAVILEFPDLPFLKSLTPDLGELGECMTGNVKIPPPSAYSQELLKSVDFVVCLGGDGTILWVSGLYNGPCPPVVSFAMGSLGFLTPFDISEYRTVLSSVVTGDIEIGVRTRLQCTVHTDTRSRVCEYMTLNEVSVDRGPSPYLTNIECYCNDDLLTSSEGDGVIIATPTGSTAYSLAAGGSMVHPDVPGMLLTPICVHTLAFRPTIFPDSVNLRLRVPPDSRNTAWCSFDGRNAMTLNKGWSVNVTTSKWPLPIVTRSGQNHDWFHGVTECLNWNNRKAQGGFDRHSSGSAN